MPHHSLPQDLPKDFVPIFQRWKWYLECKQKGRSYYEKYNIEKGIAFLNKIVDADVFEGMRVRRDFIVALQNHVFEEEEELAGIEDIPDDE